MDSNNMMFSVAMCVYKNDIPEHFETSIESILNQTVAPNEIVIVVDGPITEELNAVVYKYEKDYRFMIIRLEKNVGHGSARSIGINNCRNELIAIMDSDDISTPTRFEKQLKHFKQNNNISIVGGNIEEFISDKENIVGRRTVPQTDDAIKSYLKKRCPFNQVTVMFKKNDVLKSGGYIDWYCNEDYYLWIRMYQNNMVFYNINETLVYVRIGNEMYQRRGGLKYFKSEAKLQHYMLQNGIISFIRYIYNIGVRFVLQVLMPNSIRGFIFKKFARSNSK